MDNSENTYLLLPENEENQKEKSRAGKFLGLFVTVAGGLGVFAVLQYAGPPEVFLQKGPLTLDSLEVTVSEGRLLGKVMQARNGRNFAGFLSVPYAKPPIGDLRFMPPRDPEPWIGLRDATEFLPYCPRQIKDTDPPSIVGNEDCLYLNIFTSNYKQNGTLFPVMLYIYGGANGYGYAHRYFPDYFMEEDVVLVIMNYRAGPLGTLNLNLPEASGNQGLKDQTQALKWIRKNIQVFGGDPEKVTIFGNSGGSFQVSMHVLSPLSRGWFHHAIFQSGTAIIPAVFSATPERDAEDLAKLSNCSTTVSSQEILKCLKNLPVEDLITNAYALSRPFTFTFSMDSASLPNDTFLPQFPLQILNNQSLANVPLMTGVTSAEGLMDSLKIYNDPEHQIWKIGNDLEALAQYFAQNDLDLNLSASDPLEVATKIVQFYFPQGIDKNSTEVFWNFTNLFTDRDYAHPMHVIINKQMKSNLKNFEIGNSQERNKKLAPIYAYYFSQNVEYSHQGPQRQNWTSNFDGLAGAPAHADELQFLYPMDYTFPPIMSDHKLVNFSRQLIKFWINFANTGDPGVAANGVRWLPVVDVDGPIPALELTEDPKMIQFVPERMNFWDQLNLSDLYR